MKTLTQLLVVALVIVAATGAFADEIDNKLETDDANLKPHWVTDGSTGFLIHQNSITSTNSAHGTQYNALWKENEQGPTSGTHYWTFSIEDASDTVWIGLTDLTKFKPGWFVRGLFYGGNLSSGSGLLVGGFGPRIKSGDKIGLLAIFDLDGQLRVYLFVNGESLGLAFEVPAEGTLDGIFPVVSFYGKGSLQIEKSNEIPTNLERTPPNFHGMEGDWELSDFQYQGEKQALPITTTLNIKKDPRSTSYRMSLRVVNSIRGRLSELGSGVWKINVGASTRMGGSEEVMKLEHSLTSGLESVNFVEVNGDGDLIMKGNEESELEALWKRYDVQIEHVVGNPFN